MKEIQLHTRIQVFALHELSEEWQRLVSAARKATTRSYAPYSHFHVGAAALLENGLIVTGSNQENAAYPSGLCAERTALFHANSQYPEQAVCALAIAACREDGREFQAPISPCGACRQVMLETERRFDRPMQVLLCGKEEIYIAESAASLLPLAFG